MADGVNKSDAGDIWIRRVDPPHGKAPGALLPDASDLLAMAGWDRRRAVEQLRKQVAQIAQRLRARQRELALREAELAARLAAWQQRPRPEGLSGRLAEGVPKVLLEGGVSVWPHGGWGAPPWLARLRAASAAGIELP